MGSLDNLDIKVIDCTSDRVELEFIKRGSVGEFSVDVRVVDGDRSLWLDSKKYYITSNSEKSIFYIDDPSVEPDSIKVELQERSGHERDERVLDVGGSDDISGGAAAEGNNSSVGSEDSENISSEDENKGLLETITDEFRKDYEKEDSENSGSSESENSGKEFQESNKVHESKTKSNEMTSDSKSGTEGGSGKNKNGVEGKSGIKVNENKGGENVSERIIKLSKNGFSPKEIAEKLDTSINNVYVVRSNNNLTEKTAKKDRIIDYLEQGFSPKEISNMLDTSESYVYNIKNVNNL